MSVQLLDTAQSRARLKRMAYEILENTYPQSRIFLFGIVERGFVLTEILADYLRQISASEVIVTPINKYDHPDQSALQAMGEHIENKHLVLVDDVLYTGRSVFDALQKLSVFQPAKVDLAVLIDRGHHHLPLTPNIVGLELGTTLKEYIRVNITPDLKTIEAFLE